MPGSTAAARPAASPAPSWTRRSRDRRAGDMTRLILTRHGHVDWIAPERFRGRAELALSELGRRQVEATAKRIAAAWRPAAVYTSPMSRAVDTGTAIAGPFGLTVQPIGGLHDNGYGGCQGPTPHR